MTESRYSGFEQVYVYHASLVIQERDASNTPPLNYTCGGDLSRNLTNHDQPVSQYDSENQLTNVHVSGQWRSEFAYDGLMRRRVRKEFTWSGGAWVKTNEEWVKP